MAPSPLSFPQRPQSPQRRAPFAQSAPPVRERQNSAIACEVAQISADVVIRLRGGRRWIYGPRPAAAKTAIACEVMQFSVDLLIQPRGGRRWVFTPRLDASTTAIASEVPLFSVPFPILSAGGCALLLTAGISPANGAP